MFDRYTEKARRVIFFARYEASQFGSRSIETEHILIGILREDKTLTHQLFPHSEVQSIREQIEKATLIREQVSTSVDLPLSKESQRVLAYAAEEGNRLNHEHITSGHLLLGLLREEGCFAARLLQERGVNLESARSIVGGGLPQQFATGAGPSGAIGIGGLPHGHAETRVIMRRAIVFQNEADGANLGECFSIDIPRIGDEVVLPGIRARATRVVFQYQQTEYEIEGEKANLKPQKIVVYVKMLEP